MGGNAQFSHGSSLNGLAFSYSIETRFISRLSRHGGPSLAAFL